MRVLVWQWGRFGAGPRIGADFAAALDGVPGFCASLSLSRQSELMQGAAPPPCALPVDTYDGLAGFAARAAVAPFLVPQLTRRIRALAPDAALCAMPGVLDLTMHWALRRAGIPYAIVVHDADAHPGDFYGIHMPLQRALVRRADAIVTLTSHVEEGLAAQGLLHGRPVIRTSLPPPPMGGLPPPRQHGGPFRLLSFGRLMAYKGLDLLAEALALILPDPGIVVRVVGQGPESAALDALRDLPGVIVENRWVPEAELPSLLGWADAVVLSHREASQSGVAATSLAAGRPLIATRVGGLAEQVGGNPAALLCDVSAPALAGAIRTMRDHPPAAPPPNAAYLTEATALAHDLARALRPAQAAFFEEAMSIT